MKCPHCNNEVELTLSKSESQEILDKIVNYNQNKLRWLWNDGEIFIALSSIKQQLNQPKTEKENSKQ
jgi:hypothetical protein